MEESMHVIGVMSGTSLDGIDVAKIIFKKTNIYDFILEECKTYPYSIEWQNRLRKAHSLSKQELIELNTQYTHYLASIINQFIQDYHITNIHAICSHGHTILHQPHNNFTLQIGNLPELSTLTKNKVVCNFRVQDITMGGQGAPLVPVGDQLLFSEYKFCLNLGGFANISFSKEGKRIAYDICPVNVVLNKYALMLGFPYDSNGNFAAKGTCNSKLLKKLNELSFYKKEAPKSLGIEWVESIVFPLIDEYNIEPKDVLKTFVIHISQLIGQEIKKAFGTVKHRVLITGGGAYNSFLIQQIKKHVIAEVCIPKSSIIEYKEALIFGLLGVLKIKDEINVFASVTGARENHSSGQIFNPK